MRWHCSYSTLWHAGPWPLRVMTLCACVTLCADICHMRARRSDVTHAFKLHLSTWWTSWPTSASEAASLSPANSVRPILSFHLFTIQTWWPLMTSNTCKHSRTKANSPLIGCWTKIPTSPWNRWVSMHAFMLAYALPNNLSYCIYELHLLCLLGNQDTGTSSD